MCKNKFKKVILHNYVKIGRHAKSKGQLSETDTLSVKMTHSNPYFCHLRQNYHPRKGKNRGWHGLCNNISVAHKKANRNKRTKAHIYKLNKLKN